MSKRKPETKKLPKSDLRQGQRGSLTQPASPLAGGEPLYSLEDPPLATPNLRTPPGQATRE
jgi:hypothetical protein